MDTKTEIITDLDGTKIVLINEIRFKGKKKEEWVEIEESLKKYTGLYYEIEETSEKIYIARDFSDEFVHGKDKMSLTGKNIRAKANVSQAIEDLIKIATNKSYAPDYAKKHKRKAKYGWYKYDTRLGLPVYESNGKVKRYNIYKIRMVVRCSEDGRNYLYDFLRVKKEKEMSSPPQ